MDFKKKDLQWERFNYSPEVCCSCVLTGSCADGFMVIILVDIFIGAK